MAMRGREREEGVGGAGGSVRERAAMSDAAQSAKSTSSSLTRRQSSGERAFSCTNPHSPQPASIFTMAATASSPSHPTALTSSVSPAPSLCPFLCSHNATLAEDGKAREDTQLQNPSRPHHRQLLMGLPQQTKREKQTRAATLLLSLHTRKTNDEMI